ncbi:uncharacterized protein LOC121389631 [Gigantopelta aegis]|uniref:uncharacterized protein LOC121389631 n=1 Tax=Gigantopelta aegis TaxID=1735272 RepID=UPI001B88E0AF|nr:uncharacterized protein LOC121389631 [Gigantopelta aegis]
MKSSTIWQILVLTGILTKHSSQGNKVCPIETTTKYSNFPLVHMCEDATISGVTGFFLDAFVPANTTTTCNCSLETNYDIQIGINIIKHPDEGCQSEFSILVDESQRTVIHNCSNVRPITNFQQIIKPGAILMKLKTVAGHQDTAYCMQIYNAAASGRESC